MNSVGSSFIAARPRTAQERFRRIVVLALALLVSSPPAQSQSQQPQQQTQQPASYPSVLSDLALENLNRVAAPAAQIEEVLRREPGLLVELKRWVAKEATDHGQMVDETEMTEQAIFDQLSRDLTFRAVATRLLQRYGYLLPKPNPDSEAAIEQQLLLQERQRQLQKAFVEEGKPLNASSETRSGMRKTAGVGQPPPDLTPVPATPRNPLDDLAAC